MKLSPRLKAIAEMIPPGSRVADIGTDHGYLPVYLIESRISPRVIATDVSRGPLSKAIEQIKRHDLQSTIEARLGNGLKAIKPGEVDVIVIAGMGGVLITDILKAGISVVREVKRIILQPMNAQDAVRKWLVHNEFCLADEVLVQEKDKIYQLIAAEPGWQQIEDPIFYEIGKKLIEKKDPLLPVLVKQKIKENKDIIDKLGGVNSPAVVEKRTECRRKIERYREVINLWR